MAYQPEKRAEDQWKFNKWFEEYQKLGGKSSKEEFAINLDTFFKITLDPVVYGDLSKSDGTEWESLDEGWEHLVREIGSPVEARRYFEAVDNITPYS